MKKTFLKGLFLTAASLVLFPAVIFFEFQAWTASVGVTEKKLPIAISEGQFSDLLRTPLLEGGSKFETSETTSASLKSNVVVGDARPLIIKRYLDYYQSPLAPYSEYIFEISQQAGMDYRLLVAIAQQESNLCKKIPDDSYNCWGWGIHSRGTLRFSSYPEAIKTVSEGIKENYIDKELETPEQIMSKYTPSSNGSWAAGVSQFMEEMEDDSYHN
jgi:hypothetical protein